MYQGYIKLWRKALDSNVWKNQKLWRFWTWCLLKASHKKYKTMVGFQEIELDVGQFVFGRKACAKETGLSEQNIRTCVRILNDSELTIKPTNKFSIGTIIKWDTYQFKENNLTNKQPASNQQVTTNKNVKNEKKKDNRKKFIPPSEKDVIEYFKVKGYRADSAKKAFQFYSEADPPWTDSNGKKVLGWKQKMISVWFKPDNKQLKQGESNNVF